VGGRERENNHKLSWGSGQCMGEESWQKTKFTGRYLIRIRRRREGGRNEGEGMAVLSRVPLRIEATRRERSAKQEKKTKRRSKN